MSMQSDCEYGYGFSITIENEKFLEFIRRHEDSIKKMLQGKEILDKIEEYDELKITLDELFNFLESLEDELNGWCIGALSILAFVMRDETEIEWNFYASDDLNDENIIMFPVDYPWNFNEKERNLKRADLDAIIKKYGNDLGVSLSPDHLRYEMYG